MLVALPALLVTEESPEDCLFPDSFLCHHFFCVSQMFEIGDVDSISVEGKEYDATRESFCISSFKIPESSAIPLLFLVFFFNTPMGKIGLTFI